MYLLDYIIKLERQLRPMEILFTRRMQNSEVTFTVEIMISTCTCHVMSAFSKLVYSQYLLGEILRSAVRGEYQNGFSV